MKRTVLLFAILLPLTICGQTIDHFMNMDSKWFVADTYPNANPQNPNFAETRTIIYGFQGDTLINGNTWLKMYSSPDSLFNSNLNFEGLIRSSNDIILLIDSNNQTDTLYDFSLNVGDSILFDFGYGGEYIPIITVDSIQINSQYYKRFIFDEPIYYQAFTVFNEVWIEGIGSIHGPLFPIQPEIFSTEWPDSLFLTCSYSGGQHYWQHPSYSSCIVNILLGITEFDYTFLKVYPNPFYDNVTIESKEPQDFNIDIYNIHGQKILSKIVESIHPTVDLSELEEGNYFLNIKSGKKLTTKKIIKKY